MIPKMTIKTVLHELVEYPNGLNRNRKEYNSSNPADSTEC